MKKFIGIDQSYTSSGYCVIDESGSVIELGTVKTSSKDNGDIYNRSYVVATALAELVEKYNPEYFGIEGLAFSMMGNATRDLAGLQFVIITQFRHNTKYGNNMVIVSPNLLKKFATGSGKAKKQDMVNALPKDVLMMIEEKKYKKSTGLYDVADAYFIAMYTLEEYKQSLTSPNNQHDECDI